MVELVVEISLAASSKAESMGLLLDISPGGREPGCDGEGKCLVEPPAPPGEGARLGGVERPRPLSSLMP